MNDLVELDENGQPMLSRIDEADEEEFKSTAYANNAFAIDEEKLFGRDSVAISEDVRSTDIEDSQLSASRSAAASASQSDLPPLSRQSSSSFSVGGASRASVLVDVSLLEGPYEQLVKRQ